MISGGFEARCIGSSQCNQLIEGTGTEFPAGTRRAFARRAPGEAPGPAAHHRVGHTLHRKGWRFMRTPIVPSALLGLIMIYSTAIADPVVFFDEQFSGPTLDSSAWRTEILISGPRFCCDTTAPWSPGHWVDEGMECHGVAAYSPYGSALLSGGLLGISSSNVRAFPVLLSRLPGPVPLFPPSGDFTFKVRIRYDRVTPWGDGIAVLQTESTEPVGDNEAFGPPQNLVLHLWSDPGGVITVYTAIGGSLQRVADATPATEFHEFELDCAGTSFTISVDGLTVYGPVSSAMRPAAVSMGNAAIAFWYPTDWTSFSIDYIRVEVPGPVPVVPETWGAVKARFRD
jgi:hypothetical protein